MFLLGVLKKYVLYLSFFVARLTLTLFIVICMCFLKDTNSTWKLPQYTTQNCLQQIKNSKETYFLSFFFVSPMTFFGVYQNQYHVDSLRFAPKSSLPTPVDQSPEEVRSIVRNIAPLGKRSRLLFWRNRNVDPEFLRFVRKPITSLSLI